MSGSSNRALTDGLDESGDRAARVVDDLPVDLGPPVGSGPTTVFRQATVFDGRHYRGAAGDVVVRDGRIVALGPDAGDGFAGAAIVDATGGLLAPGFVDAHVHAVQGGLERVRCDLTGVEPHEAAYLRAVGRYAADHPRLTWVQGGGWAMSAFPGGAPTAAALDRVVSDRPVCLPNRDHHGVWVNSAALRLAGLTAATPDPADGRIERGADGHPTGMLHEGAMRLVTEHLPAADPDEMSTALAVAQTYLHSLGVTAWQDAIVGSYSGLDDNGSTYHRAARDGWLTASVVGALWWDRTRGVEQIEDLVARREQLSVGRFRASSVKIMLDGVAENGTAAMLEPYLDGQGAATTNAGMLFVDPSDLRAGVSELDRRGFQVHVHGLGDRAVRVALDAFEGTTPGRRHHIAHLQFVHGEDVPRFADLGVCANVQALWACRDEEMLELTLPFLGPHVALRQYPFGDLVRAGTAMVAGSDWPVSTPDPLQALHVAVNRTAWGDSGPAGTEPLLPEQAIALETAFAAYTSGSSRINHRDDAGLVAAGAVADLVLLDRDPFVDPSRTGEAAVVSTWIDGALVHEA